MCQKGYELTIVYTALCLSFLVKNLFNWNVASIHSETVGLEISYFIMKDWTPQSMNERSRLKAKWHI